MSVELPPATVEAVVEQIASERGLAGSAFARVFAGEDVTSIDALGKCTPDPIVYSDNRESAFALFECRGDLGHFGMAIHFALNADIVKQASIMTINQIGDANENG